MDFIVTSYIDGRPLLAHRPPVANPNSQGHFGYVCDTTALLGMCLTKLN